MKPPRRLRLVHAKSRRAQRRGFDWFRLALVAVPLAGASAVFLWDGLPAATALPLAGKSVMQDRESARFAACGPGPGWTCVVDGDTIRYRGEKIRLADINTPETWEAGCAHERQLGERAKVRLTQLLNAGPFTLEPVDRDTDRYGRTLRIITRGGESLGDVLVDEGLAERWKGYRREWC